MNDNTFALFVGGEITDFWYEIPLSETSPKPRSVFAVDTDGGGDLDVLGAYWGTENMSYSDGGVSLSAEIKLFRE